MLILGVVCACPNGPGRQCTVYGACQQRCPNAVHRSHDGVPIIYESGDERELVAGDNKQVMKCINKRRVETCSVTLDLELKYMHLLNKVFSPLVCRLIKKNQLSLCRLKIWVCSLRRNLQPQMYNEQQVEKILNLFFPQWYDTIWLRMLIDKIEQHLGRELDVKKSLWEFDSSVDQFLSARVFLQGVDTKGQPHALLCIDPEWNRYPAYEFHLIYKRAVAALKQVRGCNYTVLFCTVLKACVIQKQVDGVIRKFKQAIVKETACDVDHYSIDNGFPDGLEEVGPSIPRMIVTGMDLTIPVLMQSDDYGYSQLELYDKNAERYVLMECLKPFFG